MRCSFSTLANWSVDRTSTGLLFALGVLGLMAVAPASAAEPFRYFVGKEVVVAQVTSTTKVTREITTLKDGARKSCAITHVIRPPGGAPDQAANPELCITERTATNREGTVVTKLVPDPALAFDLTIPGKAFTDDTVTIELRDGMLLQSINLQSTGRAGEVITSIARFAGMFFGGLPAIVARGLGPPPPPVAASTPQKQVSTCDPFVRPLVDQPDVVRLWLWESQTHCDRWRAILSLQESRRMLLQDRQSIEHQIRGATGAELKLLLDKLAPIETAIKKNEATLQVEQESFTEELEAFTAGAGLGSTSSTQTYDQVLDLADLPAPTGLSPGMALATVDTVSQKFSDQAKQLWQQARLVVTFEPIVAVKCPLSVTTPGKSDRDEVNIHFRQGTPARMRVFLGDEPPDPAQHQLHVVGDRFDNYIHPCQPVSAMTFSRSAWSKRELSLTFDERGRPLKLARASASDVAAIAASASAAASALRDEVASTLSKTVEAQANRRKLDMNALTRQIEQEKGELELLNAQLARDAAATNFDVLLKQKVAAAKLESSQAELAVDVADSTSEQREQIEQLKIQIALLAQQLELVKAEQALQKAR
jgi:hypothetical protein